ncbi:MAG: hypothetical protein QOF89_3207 [Acidobacteriota bacterium]|nr:hypothetical protein [Acidobacteriota bacterium]
MRKRLIWMAPLAILGMVLVVRRRMVERWERMTPEEREQFRQGVRGRCCFGPSTSESKGS